MNSTTRTGLILIFAGVAVWLWIISGVHIHTPTQYVAAALLLLNFIFPGLHVIFVPDYPTIRSTPRSPHGKSSRPEPWPPTSAPDAPLPPPRQSGLHQKGPL